MDASDPRGAHCSNDDLVLRALGEPVLTPGCESHLAACAACQSQADELRAVVMTGRAVSAADRLITPPPTLWEGVAGAIRDDNVVQLPTHTARSNRTRTAALVAAAAAVVLIASVAVVAPWRDANAPKNVASGQIALTPLGSSTARGEAVMTTTPAGASMTVDVPNLPATTGFYEVWLMGGPDKLVSLGVLDSRHHGTFPVPAGLDTAKYPYVDVSLEALDGNPAHSGDSIVRGQLPT